LNLPGVRFVPIRFSPKERQFAGTDCGGVQIMIADRSQFEPIDLGIGLALTLHRLYPEHWKPEGFLKMLADHPAYQAVLDGKTIDEVRQTWHSELSEFETIRSKYLLYR
jgi:uncharacterized protein YbbC (DUF1343 family)